MVMVLAGTRGGKGKTFAGEKLERLGKMVHGGFLVGVAERQPETFAKRSSGIDADRQLVFRLPMQ